MYLPGTIGDLIGDLRKNMDLNQKELAEKAGMLDEDGIDMLQQIAKQMLEKSK